MFRLKMIVKVPLFGLGYSKAEYNITSRRDFATTPEERKRSEKEVREYQVRKQTCKRCEAKQKRNNSISF